MTNLQVSRVLDWMNNHLPEVVDDLQAGVNLSELCALEDVWNINFDTAFKSLYIAANGQKNAIHTGFFYGLEFLSIDRMISNWLAQMSVIRQNARDGLNMDEFEKSYEKDKIREIYATQKWIPFAYDWGGNFLGLDFDPGPKGTTGQVINFGRDENEKYVVADNFESFMKWYADQLDDGNFRINIEDDGGKSLNTKIPPSGHFLDSIRKMFKIEGQPRGV